MASPTDEAEALAQPEYWNDRYSKSEGSNPTHEWFRSYRDLQPFFARHLFENFKAQDDPKILHLGSGDSTIPRDLLDRGYKNQLCIDFSSVLVERMASQNLQGLDWIHADVRDMSVIANKSIEVAFDKGTLDAMIHGSPWDPPEDVKENASRYMNEVARVLNDNGVFLYITYRQPHFVKPLLNQDQLWNLTMEVLRENENSFEYYAFVMKKA
ncbi:hypothetical protein M433DRAFT_74677 [Acidomyces richmondensis BFW]|nr:MAG: hypothetical protein FE78DRAFT_27753 [Acidomyces sp. 'richmondensis']KYG42014.1 hypothetical protein M433DRAFT_74677 [Acidomyces richmondensis BFW]